MFPVTQNRMYTDLELISQKDRCRNIFTGYLRQYGLGIKDGQENESAVAAREKIADVLQRVSAAQVPRSIVEECIDLGDNLLCAFHATVEGIRAVVDKCNAKTAVGLYKIFAVLGRPLVQNACLELKLNSADAALAGPLQSTVDLAVVLESATVSELTVQQAAQSVHALSQLSETASRTFRQTNKEPIERSIWAVLKFSGAVQAMAHHRLDQYVNALLDNVEHENLGQLTKHITESFEGTPSVGQEKDMAATFLETACAPLQKVLDAKKIGSDGDCLVASAAVHALTTLPKEVAAWEVVFSTIATADLTPQQRSIQLAPALCHFSGAGCRWESHTTFIDKMLRPVPCGCHQLGECIFGIVSYPQTATAYDLYLYYCIHSILYLLEVS